MRLTAQSWLACHSCRVTHLPCSLSYVLSSPGSCAWLGKAPSGPPLPPPSPLPSSLPLLMLGYRLNPCGTLTLQARKQKVRVDAFFDLSDAEQEVVLQMPVMEYLTMDDNQQGFLHLQGDTQLVSKVSCCIFMATTVLFTPQSHQERSTTIKTLVFILGILPGDPFWGCTEGIPYGLSHTSSRAASP